MARNRTIYQTQNIFVGPSPATGEHSQIQAAGSTHLPLKTKVRQLQRVQSANYGYTIARQDVNQFGELAAIDRVALEAPTVNLDISWLQNGFANEETVGFSVNSNTSWASLTTAIGNILNKTSDEKNYFIQTVPEGYDAVGQAPATTNTYINIGNGFLSNYTATAAVGGFPTATITVEGLNFVYTASEGPAKTKYNGVTGYMDGDVVMNPAVNPVDGTKLSEYVKTTTPSLEASVNHTGWTGVIIPTGYSTPHTGDGGTRWHSSYVSVLRPGDVNLAVVNYGGNPAGSASTAYGLTWSDLKIQSYNLAFGLTREPLQKLGSKYAFSREITFPVQVTLSLEANIGDAASKNLADMISEDQSYDCYVMIKNPTGTAVGGNYYQMCYALKNAKLDSQQITSSIGPNKAVTLNFVSQIGGPNQTDRGLFFSGLDFTNIDSRWQY